MSFAITLNKIGGPEVLHWEAIHGSTRRFTQP
jgi:hypothetical protein